MLHPHSCGSSSSNSLALQKLLGVNNLTHDRIREVCLH